VTRGSPFTTAGFARMIGRAARSAGLELKAYPHIVRHARGRVRRDALPGMKEARTARGHAQPLVEIVALLERAHRTSFPFM
jgi:hypothetical protein